MSGCMLDVIRGNQTLFMRRDEVEAAWRWVDPIREAWDENQQSAAGLYGRHLGAVGLGRADRARRPDLAREQLTMTGAISPIPDAVADGAGRPMSPGKLTAAIAARGRARSRFGRLDAGALLRRAVAGARSTGTRSP